MNEESAKKLREPFPPHQIGKLPRKSGGGTVQLDYVGHAAVTDRLLEVDTEWNWEPVAFTEHGSPLIVRQGDNAVLWIRLTVAGTTRLGVGIVRSDAFELEKQLISDAIRNGAMRFGVALDLWSKEDLGPDPHRYDQAGRADADGKPLHGPAEEPTAAGNVRRGPRVREGWSSAEEQRRAMDELTTATKALSEQGVAAMARWRTEKGYDWPMSMAEHAEAMAQLAALTHDEHEEEAASS